MATAGSPPKPWERAAAGNTSAAVPTTTATATAATPTSDAPALPSKPDSLNSVATRNAGTYSSPMNRTSPYSSPYGYGSSPYSSPYNRFGGGMGSMYGGGGYGGYGGMGGMYGGGMGYGGYGGGMYGQPGMPGQEQQSLTQTMNMSTQATFQMIESIVGAFGGFAQMLESTYMATHSSFFAMVSVAEQFGNLRQTLGSMLGIYTVIRWIKTAVAKLTGRPPPASSKDLTPANFAAFSGSPTPDGAPGAQPRPSRKPFIVFIIAVFGLPYLMGKLIKALAASQEAEQQRQLANAPHEGQSLDPSKLDFCRVLYDYTPTPQPGQPFTEGIDLAVKKGDLVAVLSKTDPMGQSSEWWRCRARDGRMGYLPSPYLETIQRRPQQAQIAAKSNQSSPTHSRVNTMTSKSGSEGRANSMATTKKEVAFAAEKGKEAPKVEGKPGDISVESFQRAAFNS